MLPCFPVFSLLATMDIKSNLFCKINVDGTFKLYFVMVILASRMTRVFQSIQLSPSRLLLAMTRRAML